MKSVPSVDPLILINEEGNRTTQELERNVRRVFEIADGRKLVIATKIKSTAYKKIDIDPKIWPIIKDSVAAIWVREGPTSAWDIKGSEQPVCDRSSKPLGSHLS